MHIAIAGAGDVAKYLVEEFLAVGHVVTVISRSSKPWFERENVSMLLTDYSASSLDKVLVGCHGLVSVVADYSMRNVDTHLALLDACTRSPTCKYFIPSEYAGNIDDYPDQPMFYNASHDPIREALRAQDDVKWTLFNTGWLSDYFVPLDRRYLKDIAEAFPYDWTTRKLTIPGTGDEKVSFTAVRDAAKAIAKLFGTAEWEPTTYVCGETTTWNKVAETLKQRDLVEVISRRSLATIVNQIVKAESEESVLVAQYELCSVSGCLHLPEDRVQRLRATHLEGIHFRTIEELLDDGTNGKDGIL